MIKTKVISVGIVGMGYWGPNILRNLLKIPNVIVVAVCDLKQTSLDSIKLEHPQIITTKKFSDLLKNKSIDAIIIATPTSTHYSLGIKALLANKHVLIEKPLTKTSIEAKKLIQLAEKKQKILMVGHTFVYSEGIKKIKKIIESKTLGKIFYYDSVRINLGLMQPDVNVVWDLAPHDLSIISYLFNSKPIAIQAIGATYVHKSQEDDAHIFISFENNFKVHIHLSWLSPVKLRTILIGGSKKMIVYNDIEPSEKIRIYNKQIIVPKDKITPFTPAYRSGDVVIPQITQTEALYNELLHFLQCIQLNKTPLTDGNAGLIVVELLESITHAIKKKKEIIL